MSLPHGYAELRDRILQAIDAPPPPAELDALLMDIFRFQYAAVASYRGYCARREVEPGTVHDWTDIPAVPTTAFRVAPLLAGPIESAVTVFRTSGTTGGTARRGEHHLLDLSLYEASLLQAFRRQLLPEKGPIAFASLTPDPRHTPDSSLGHMAGIVAQTLGSEDARFARAGGSLDLAGAIAWLEAAERAGEPVCLLATAFSLVHLLDEMGRQATSVTLPSGSRLMETGGFKGRSREVDRSALYALVEERTGIPARWIVNEYGMTELGSQFYDGVAGRGAPLPERVHEGPGWTRTRAADPETLELLPAGEAGLLRHWDPVNLGSIAVVQTEDLGVVNEDGSFRLLGRLEGAEPRGCSMALEDVRRAVEGEGGAGRRA